VNKVTWKFLFFNSPKVRGGNKCVFMFVLFVIAVTIFEVIILWSYVIISIVGYYMHYMSVGVHTNHLFNLLFSLISIYMHANMSDLASNKLVSNFCK
jgi:hypothetical protein